MSINQSTIRTLKKTSAWSIGGAVVISLVAWGVSYYKSRPQPANQYLNIKLGDTKEQVQYVKGKPTDVLFPGKLATGQEFYQVATSEEVSSAGGFKTYNVWHYNDPSGYVSVTFNNLDKQVESVGCYMDLKGPNASIYFAQECSINGLKPDDTEDFVYNRLGKPEKEETEDGVKVAYYPNFNLRLIFEKQRLYFIVMERINKGR